MKTYTFKTSIKCGGCIEKVTPFLNELTAVKQWEVDTVNPDKVLTVQTEGEVGSIVEKVEAAGFRITLMD
jgi:copper chaperone